MTLHEDVQILKNIPLFANIDEAKLKILAFTGERLTFEPGERLFGQGERADAAFVVIEGRADVTVDGPKGSIAVAHVERNDIVGEIAILCDVPRTATVTAATRLVVLRLTTEIFFRFVNEFPQMAIEVMRELAQRLEYTTQALSEAYADAGRREPSVTPAQGGRGRGREACGLGRRNGYNRRANR